MSAFLALWLPTLVSAVAVFILSFIAHMAIPKWHSTDYPKLPDEAPVLDALRPFAIPPGEYMAPRPANNAEMQTAEFKEKQQRGPVILLNVFPSGEVSLGRFLGLWFIYVLVVAALSGHVAWAPYHDNFDARGVFHTVALTSFLGYVAALWQGTIWYRRSVLTALKSTIDGAIYALATGWIFCYLWPK
jgi:hypothetical protein